MSTTRDIVAIGIDGSGDGQRALYYGLAVDAAPLHRFHLPVRGGSLTRACALHAADPAG